MRALHNQLMSKALNILLGIATVVLAVLYFGSSKHSDSAAIGSGGPNASPASTGSTDDEYVLVAVSVGNANGSMRATALTRREGAWRTWRLHRPARQRRQAAGRYHRERHHPRGQRIDCCSRRAEAVIPVIDRAIAAGIPVITQDTDSPKSQRYTFIGTGNF